MASSSSSPSVLLLAASKPVYNDEIFLQFKSHMRDALGKDITLVQFGEAKELIDVDNVLYIHSVDVDEEDENYLRDFVASGILVNLKCNPEYDLGITIVLGSSGTTHGNVIHVKGNGFDSKEDRMQMDGLKAKV